MTDALPDPSTLPYGCWPSPVSASDLTAPSFGMSDVAWDGGCAWWSELRPHEGGRLQVVRQDAEGRAHDVLPDDMGARTLVHEYGGGAWAVHDGTLLVSNLADQRLYRVDGAATATPEQPASPVPISPAPRATHALRWADTSLFVTEGRTWVLAVRESHEADAVAAHGEPVNEVVALPLDGAAVDDAGQAVVLVSGPDFVASPRVGRGGDGSHRLAWVQWDHPHMPFDSTSLHVAELGLHGGAPALGPPTTVAGGDPQAPEAVMTPCWVGDTLWFVTDRGGWWNLHRWDGADVQRVGAAELEVGGPAWTLGGRPYDVQADGTIVCAVTEQGRAGLAVVDPADPGAAPRRVRTDAPELSDVRRVAAAPDGSVLAVAGGPTLPVGVVRVAPDGSVTPLLDTTGVVVSEALGPEWVSVGRHVEFASGEGRTAHATFYPPCNPEAAAPEETLPPLVVFLHGGPTGHSAASRSAAVQYWTTRGFAIADVDYTGSTGYGRDYRMALYGAWGVVDVEDCLAVVRHLADEGLVDGTKAAIRGGSAGGFTTLACLTHPDNPFATGANYFGVADLKALADFTHKFESRYLDGLLGPLPEAEQVYRDRSPITHVDRLAVPLVVFQGDEDKVVPPEQSRSIVEAVRARGLECEYVELAGEQHGFRKASSIVQAAETELAFYQRVLGLGC